MTRTRPSIGPSSSTRRAGGSLVQRSCGCGSTAGHCSCNSGPLDRGASGLQIGSPLDERERQADRVADEVMRMPADALAERIDADEEARPTLLRSLAPDASMSPSARRPAAELGLRTEGRPLDSPTRDFMQARFGQDFSKVRVHTGPDADRSARSVQARAFTVGQNVVMARGQYAPTTSQGRRLLAHELAHTLQQRSGDDSVLRRESWNDDTTNCTSTVTYTVQTIFEDNGADVWTDARKRTFRSKFEQEVESAFNGNSFRIRPLTRGTMSTTCECHDEGFAPRVEIDFTPMDEMSTSEDLEVDVVANASGTFIRSSQNTLLGYGNLDEDDVNSNGSQVPAVHEFGHFLGLQHPGEGLEGGIFSDSQLSPGADVYSHVGTDVHGRTVNGPTDLMGQGMGMRPFYFDGWASHLNSRFDRFCMYGVS